MKLPEPTPDLASIRFKDPARLVALLTSSEAQKYVVRANQEYLHWERAKYLDLPASIPAEDLWLLIKLSRTSNMKSIPLADPVGNSFGFWLPDPVLSELHFIDQNAGGSILIDNPQLSSEARERYLISSLMEEAIASSQIEGAATTRKVAKEMLREGRPPKNKAEKMILNNYQTIRRIKAFLGQPLSLEILHELHRSLTEGTLDDPAAAGRFRSGDDICVIDESDGQILHVPPPARDLPTRMEKFLSFANDKDDEPFIHPVVRAILLHFWLGYEHPYVDGNGRTARAVFYWYMLSRNYWLFEYSSISRIILKSVRQYARAYLYSETDGRDITYFLVYHLKAIRLALEELHRYLARKQEEMRKATAMLHNVPDLNYRQIALLQHAVKHAGAVYTIESHKNSHNVVRATASADLADLVERGFLSRKRLNRRYYFVAVPDVAKKLAIPELSI
ncbi:MAG: Fic family protein [Thermodesulfobacteriota bacterium]